MSEVKVKAEEVKILPPEEDAQVGLEIATLKVSLNVTDDVLADLKERYSGLTIKDQQDKEGYVRVSESRKNIKAIRVAVEKGFTHLRQIDRLKVAKKIAEENKVVAFLSALEDPLYKMEKDFDAEDTRIKEERKAKIEQQSVARMAELMGYGAQLQGSNWVMDDVSFDAAMVKGADDDIYKEISDAFKPKFDIKEKDRLEKEQLQKDKDAEFDRQQKELKRLQQEAKDSRTENRIAYLKSLGMDMNAAGTHHTYADQLVSVFDVVEKEAQDWEVIVVGVTAGIEKAKALAEEVRKNREIFANRLPLLKEWSSNGSDVYFDGKVWGTTADIIQLSEDDFKILLQKNEGYLAKKEEDKEIKRKQDLQDAADKAKGGERRKSIRVFGTETFSTDLELGKMSDEGWSAVYSESKKAFDDAEKKKADDKLAEDNAKLNDKGKWDAFLLALGEIPLPEFKSRNYKEVSAVLVQKLDQIKALKATR